MKPGGRLWWSGRSPPRWVRVKWRLRQKQRCRLFSHTLFIQHEFKCHSQRRLNLNELWEARRTLEHQRWQKAARWPPRLLWHSRHLANSLQIYLKKNVQRSNYKDLLGRWYWEEHLKKAQVSLTNIFVIHTRYMKEIKTFIIGCFHRVMKNLYLICPKRYKGKS